jgi:glutamine synthetase
MQAMSAEDELVPLEGLGPVGEVRLVPEEETFRELPYLPAAGAVLVDMLTLDGEPWDACPRSFLKVQLARLESELGASLQSAFEAKSSLARSCGGGEYVPIDESLCSSTTGMNAAADVIDEIQQGLDSQQLTVEQYYAELDHG